jgi:hypothetical protein
MPRSGAEVADVELVGGKNLGRGKGRRMEHGRNERREFGRGRAAGTRVEARGAS